MNDFHWYPDYYLDAVALLVGRGYKGGYIKPYLYLVEIYWPGHGVPFPCLDLYFAANHNKHVLEIIDKRLGTFRQGSILHIVECKWDYRHVMGLHPYRFSFPLREEDGDIRIQSNHIAALFNYRGEMYEFTEES